MNSLTWLFAGAVLGWLIALVLRRHFSAQLFNIIVGMFGTIVTGSFIAPVLLTRRIIPGIFNLPALLISLGGAVILLAIVNFFSKENNVGNRVFERRWEQVSDKISTRWGKLTREDIAKIDGDYNRFVAAVQTRYGYSHREAEYQIQRYMKAVLVGGSRHSFMYDQAEVANSGPE